MKEHCKRIPGASAELRQKLLVIHEMQPQHLRNTPHPMPMSNRSEEFFPAANPGKAIVRISPPEILLYNLIGDWAPEAVLRANNRKFIDRFTKMESILRKAGYSLDEVDMEMMENAWQTAKLE